MKNLSVEELEVVKSSLNYYKLAIAEYKLYTDLEFKNAQLKRVENILAKLKPVTLKG